jgi:hypothetical protein
MKFTTRDVTTPFEGAEVYLNRWWACKDGLKTQALFYQDKFPQCNKQEHLLRWHCREDQTILPPEYNPQPVFIEVAYVPKRD